MHKYLSTPCQCGLTLGLVPYSTEICFFQSCFQVTYCICARLAVIRASHRTHLDGRKHKAIPSSVCCLLRWDIGIDTSPLFSEHEVILLMACRPCTPKFDFALRDESKNLKQFIMLFVPHVTSYRLQFISYLGVLRAIFLHFQWLTVIFFSWSCTMLTKLLPPAMMLEHHRKLHHYTEAS